MSLGPTELLVVVINLILLLAIPAIIIVSAVLVIRKIRELEARVTKLEEGNNGGKSPGNGS
jgi:hypothetical protein